MLYFKNPFWHLGKSLTSDWLEVKKLCATLLQNCSLSVVRDELFKFYSDTMYRFILKSLTRFIISVNFYEGKDGHTASSTESCEEFDGDVGYTTVSLLCQWSYGGCVTKLPHTRHSEMPGLPGRFVLHSQESCWNFSYHCLLLFLTGRSFPNLLRKFRCTSAIDWVLAYSITQKSSVFHSPPFSFILLPRWPPTKLRVRDSCR